VQLGDCLVFENVFDWDFGKWKHDPTRGARFYSRPEPIGIRDTQAHRVARTLAEHGLREKEKVITAAKALVSSSFSKINISPVPAASGSSVVAHEDISGRIKDLNEAIAAIDMESYGFYYAASYALTARPEMLCVKSVCDFADKSKDDKWHRICCYLSAQVVRDILLYRWAF
jgi:nucleoside phosphorylase